MSVLSGYKHIEVVKSNFNEFSNGTFTIKKNVSGGTAATYATVYDTDLSSPAVQIKLDGNVQDNTNNVPIDSDVTFRIEPQLSLNGKATVGPYSFDVNVFNNSSIIDSMTISGVITESFVADLSYNMRTQLDNSYEFDFTASGNDGATEFINKYKVISIESGITLQGKNNISDIWSALAVNGEAAYIRAIRASGFDGRVRFVVKAIDVRGSLRKATASVNQFDGSIASLPLVTFETPGFNMINGFQTIYEYTGNSSLSSGTISFRLNMFNDSKFKFFWNVSKGSKLITVNASNVMSGELAIGLNTSAQLVFASITGKFGAVVLNYGIKYNNVILDQTTASLNLRVLPATNVSLDGHDKRMYMMNKHQLNINALTADAYNLVQANQTGSFSWTVPGSQADGVIDTAYVASLIPDKKNFNNILVANIMRSDGYVGRSYDQLDEVIGLDMESLLVNVINANSNTFNIKMHPDTIAGLRVDGSNPIWLADDSLSQSDIIVDPSDFYGHVRLSYKLKDTIGNVSAQPVFVDLYVMPYSHIRIASITGDNSMLLLKDSPKSVSVTYANSNSDNDVDVTEPDANVAIKSYIKKFTQGDIDFIRATIPVFKIDGVSALGQNVSALDNQVKVNTITDNYTDPVRVLHDRTRAHIQSIPWLKSVTLTLSVYPEKEGVYTFNIKTSTNIRSIRNNNVILSSNDIEVRVYDSDIEYFNIIDANQVITRYLDVGDFIVSSNLVSSDVPVNINYSGRGNALNVDGATSLDTLNANTVVAIDMTVDTINVTSIEASGTINAYALTGGSATIDGEILADSVTAVSFVCNGDLAVNGNINVDNDILVTGTISSNTLTTKSATIDGEILADSVTAVSFVCTGDLAVNGSITVDNDILINSTLTVSTVVVNSVLEVNGPTELNDTVNCTSLQVELDTVLKGSLDISDSKVIINSDGIVTDVPVTIGSDQQSSDVLLVVNGATTTFGDVIMNDTEFVLQNGEINVGCDLNIVNDSGVSVMSFDHLTGDATITGNVTADGYKVTQSSYQIVKEITANGTQVDFTNFATTEYAYIIVLKLNGSNSTSVKYFPFGGGSTITESLSPGVYLFQLTGVMMGSNIGQYNKIAKVA